MKKILASVAYRVLWTMQAVAFALHLWKLGAMCIDGASAARNWGGWDWAAGKYA